MPCIPDRVIKTAVYTEDECRGRSVKAEISLFMKYVTFCLHIGIKEKEGERADNYGTCPERQSVWQKNPFTSSCKESLTEICRKDGDVSKKQQFCTTKKH